MILACHVVALRQSPGFMTLSAYFSLVSAMSGLESGIGESSVDTLNTPYASDADTPQMMKGSPGKVHEPHSTDTHA